MKWVRAITVCISVCLIAAAFRTATKYINRRYAVQPFPSVQKDETEPTAYELARRSYIKLPPADVQRLLTGDCTSIHEQGGFPDPIKNAFARLTEDKPFALAAPGKRFNATDVIEPGLPRRRLVLGGHCDDRWFIEYEHGGIGRSVAVIVLRINPDQSVTLVWGRPLKENESTLEHLRSALATGAYWDNPYFW
jgi:hypothetical protein